MGVKMGKDRKVEVEKLYYENSCLFCDLILREDMKKSDMKKNKASGSLMIVGLTLNEAKEVYKKLGEVLKNETRS